MDNNNDDNNNDKLLPISLIHIIFEYFGIDFKMLIHKEGSTDKDRIKILSIKLIMISGMENYFKDVLLSNKFKHKLCNISSKKGYVNILKWAREHGCPWGSDTCSSAARNGHLSCLQWARQNGCPWDRRVCLLFAKFSNHTETVRWIESTAL